MRGIEAQFLALQKGFNEIIPQHLLRPFDDRELEVSLCQSTFVNIKILYSSLTCSEIGPMKKKRNPR